MLEHLLTPASSEPDMTHFCHAATIIARKRDRPHHSNILSGPPTWQLATVPLFTGNLSVLGSGLIIYSMLVHGRRTKLRKPHHRILLAMSIYDLFYSLVKAFTFLLTPAEGQPGSMGVPGAMGNLATCRLQGFFIETAHATGAYNSLSSIYFWLSICRGVKNDTFTKYEPIAHILIFVVFVGFAIAGVVIELFNPAFGFCFIASYPPGCESGPGAPVCERWPPRTMGLMYEIFAQMWVQAYIVIVVVTNAAIWYCTRCTRKRRSSGGAREGHPEQQHDGGRTGSKEERSE
eukprot:scaffold31975_cov139-Skeletonema_marinoi.AAC.1